MIREQVRQLARQSVIYGAADVIPSLINFLLLPVFTAYLSPKEYGALGILLLFGVMTKIFFRMGLDSGFFRLYYEQGSQQDCRMLATTLFASAVTVSGVLFFFCALLAPKVTWLLLGKDFLSADAFRWFLLVAADTLLNTFAFVPMNLFRIQGRPGAFTGITLFRNGLNIALKVTLIVKGWGIDGLLWADVIASAFFVLALAPMLVRNLTLGFSVPMLKEAARFGIPKVPHGLAHQILNLSDRKLIEIFASVAASGLYHVSYMLGTGVKFFLSAFELAWSPFVYSQLDRHDAARTLSRVATYGASCLLFLALINAMFGRELLFLMAQPRFHEAHPVIPIVVLAYTLQGFFALTSIGIGISKRSYYYPILTITAATINLALNIMWIPRYGIIGAAWATVAGYAVMAALGLFFGQRSYRIPFEWGRMGRLLVAASVVYSVSMMAPESVPVAIAIKTIALLLFPFTLFLTRFFRADEVDWLKARLIPMQQIATRGRRNTPPKPDQD